MLDFFKHWLNDITKARLSVPISASRTSQTKEQEHWHTLSVKLITFHHLSGGGEAEDYQDYKATPLAPVFGRITLNDKETQSPLRYHPKPLESPGSLDVVFPKEFSEYQPGEMNESLNVFGDEFSKLASTLHKDDFDCLLTHLVGMLQKHTWCIPSNTQEEFPDVSLYDHLKTTAAIAACLYRYHQSNGNLNDKAVKADAEKFTLIIGDLSGIQNYIFDISRSGSGGVARRLRARSLFVQLLTEVASHKLLHALELPMTNVLMSSGGKFYLLAPNLEEVHQRIASVRSEIEHWLLEELFGEIALNLATVTFSHSGFKGFGDILSKSNNALQEAKLKPLIPVLQNGDGWNLEVFLREKIKYGPDGPCEACKKMPREEAELCHRCKMDDTWGRKLPQTRYIAFYDGNTGGDLDVFGYSVALHTNEERSFRSRPYMIWKLNAGETGELADYPAIPRYLANHIPMTGTVNCESCRMSEKCDQKRDPSAPATFNCLAYASEGRHLLGFLKADVDNLGKLFAFGLKRDTEQQYDTISRIATLSRMLDTFFNGWMEHLTSVEFPHCYTVFSGGDDLFLVGPWQEILRLAQRTSEDFSFYTGNNEITLSASVFVNKPGFPISRAASEAESNLELVKAREGKDGLRLLGYTLSWNDWNFLRNEWEKLSTEAIDMPSAFLYNLLAYGRMWQDYKNGNVLGLRFQPLLAYNLARNLEMKKSPKVYKWATNLLHMPVENEDKLVLDNLGLIATLLIYNRRGG